MAWLVVASLLSASLETSYSARVSIFPLPAQDIGLVLKPQNTAEIHLSGIVNLREELRYRQLDGTWHVEFGAKVRRVLSRYRCQISQIQWTEGRDLMLSLTMPIVGRITVHMTPTDLS